MGIKLKSYVEHFANLIFGMYQHTFSEWWDSRLNNLLDKGEVIEAGMYTLRIKYKGDGIEIWCSNKWYSFGNEYRVNNRTVDNERQYRPRFKTMVKLWNIYQSEREKHLDEDYLSMFKAGDAHD
ncbi:hypothetical protein HV096_19275 [Citrobacter freundii]|nr:hypothetical protein [Citrobacter freundii]MBA8034187.1 hypothetical protein [Citrobacter freundii]